MFFLKIALKECELVTIYQLEKRLSDITAEKDAQIADRDQKLSRLKSQMADALKGNSWERQQQLEELTKELSRIQEESDLLRMKIKSLSKNKQLKEKDGTISELKSLCGKFETQLTTQDKLLEQWAASKGHKIAAPK
ncbi:grip and coiled-coil domain-containing protein 2-like [Plakobranchus ocellatus]|uniref:Grip and coiled-coil domain-containing protein 2-like n=1 Tax=Plakobranchus ocellatus TaxID=259542 RepID=A0AAV4B6D6_9GAST|nr:grip and coiled-coil domain-containing protein 2-like [Plakobranchus ocellatus]